MYSAKRVMLLADREDPDAPSQSLFGLSALVTEMESQGVPLPQLLKATGVHPDQFSNPQSLISRRQRLAIYANAQRMAKRTDVGLLAGARQRVSDYGIYGYALASSRTLGDAIELSFKHLRQAGPVLQITVRRDGDVGILRSHDPGSLGELLPFVAEFWRSSYNALILRILDAPFPSVRMLFPYRAPPHWRSYSQMFHCPVEFGADVMEWHYDIQAGSRPLPNANPMTAIVCTRLCEQILMRQSSASSLALAIRTALVNRPGRFMTAREIAEHLGMSERTLHRSLVIQGLSYQKILDEMRRTLAIEFLEHTSLSIEKVAERVGFADVSNFRKAFKKWTGMSPSDMRQIKTIGNWGIFNAMSSRRRN